ncbi:hypothetical protein OROMI_016672 [Orobanche minor]
MLTEYEKKRMLQVAENKRTIHELGINKLAVGLDVKNVKENVQADYELKFDREYVPGHDSLSEVRRRRDGGKTSYSIEKMMNMKEKKLKKVTNPVSRPITSSSATTPLSMQ